MAPHRHRSPRGPAWALGVWFTLAGCSDVANRPDPEGEALRLGRVHIVLEPSEDRDAADDFIEANEAQLDVTARFAFVRGLDEDFVRARVGMPVLAHEQVPVTECVPSDQLAIDPGEPAVLDTDMRELVLVDAGDLTVRIGDTDVDVPLALVPDLLPYMSGVEYLQEAEMVPVARDPVLVTVMVCTALAEPTGVGAKSTNWTGRCNPLACPLVGTMAKAPSVETVIVVDATPRLDGR